MAEFENTQSSSKGSSKTYSTNEKDMMTDAKDYAKRDFTNVIEFLKKAGIQVVKTNEEKTVGEYLCSFTEKEVAGILIDTKFEQIKKARTERVSYFD